MAGVEISPWSSAMDEVLVVGMRCGHGGLRQATLRLQKLQPGLTQFEIWQRIRGLREQRKVDYAEIAPSWGEGARRRGSCEPWPLETGRELQPKSSRDVVRGSASLAVLAAGMKDDKRRRWEKHELHALWRWAGTESVDQIAKRLGRSERAVRCRMGALGMSAKVKDGWSLRRLEQTLHMGRGRLRRFIVEGSLRVRNPRISARSLSRRVAGEFRRLPEEDDYGYSWKQAAKLLGTTSVQVRGWIANGGLRLVDTRVTERALRSFLRTCASQLKLPLLDSATRAWLAEEYGVDLRGNENIPLAAVQKHLGVTRVCPQCRKGTRGNAHFRHLKHCLGWTRRRLGRTKQDTAPARSIGLVGETSPSSFSYPQILQGCHRAWPAG